MALTLKNDFHETSVRLNITTLPHTLSPGQCRRVRRALCGQLDCTCGVICGRQYDIEWGLLIVTPEPNPDEFGKSHHTYRIEESDRDGPSMRG